MTSRLNNRASSCLAIGAIAGLVAFIVLLWCVFARQGGPAPAVTPHNATTDGFTHTDGTQTDPSSDVSSNVLGYEHDVDTELVRLVKVGPPPISGHDFIYDLQRAPYNGTDERKEHHSGHFRHLHTSVWDPHPQYIIQAFGIQLHVRLRHSGGATSSPGQHVTHLAHNTTWRQRSAFTECLYTGELLGEPATSHVAVSLCGGMTGYIRSKEGNFYIEPAEVYHNSSEKALLHRIHRVSGAKLQDGTCDTSDIDTNTDFTPEERIFFDDIFSKEQHHVSKRSSYIKYHYDTDNFEEITSSYQSKTKEYFIEILIVADKTMFEYHKTNETLTHYILTLMSHVALLYKDATIGNPVSMYVKDILILDKVFVERQPGMIGVNSGEMLKSFCLFQNSLKGYHSPYNHDVAILLTRETICRNAATGQCDTLGLAELGTMCSASSSCAIIKDKGLPTSYTIAHELGHVLNMPHDDDLEKCSRHNEHDSEIKYIMGRMIRNDSKPWLWSNCSRRYLTDFLESNRANCLLNEPSLQEIDMKNLPGEDFSGNEQCELIFGKGLKLCTYMPKCKYLWCELDSTIDNGCQTQHQPWADGTICGPHHWCIRGSCVPQDPAILTPVAGGWGPWKRVGPCSRTCGGGVRTVERDCDHPRPQNGGPYCAGPSVRYESCNIENCEDDTEEFREQQCKRFNGNTMGVPGLTSDVKWVPKYEGILPSELCMLYCRVARTNQHYLLAERVIDGTKCGFNSHDMCVSGRCRRGGCDNRLGSNLALDNCGECGGDNSRCKEMHGQHTHKPQYGYSKVVRIPKGSSNLDIRQHGWERDGNYLALVDSESGHYVMNGDHILHAYPTVFMYAGVTFSYTGTDVAVERINSSNSVRLKKDLLVELLSVDKLLPPNITFSYMIVREKSTQYTWQLHSGSWGPCSRVCSGSQHAKPLCVQQDTGAVVPEEMCEGLDRDISLMKRECNTQCRLSWRVKHRFPCSAACGPGFRTIVYQCVRVNNTHELIESPGLLEDTLDVEGDVPWAESMDEQHCSDLQKPPEMENCEGSCEEVRWKYDEWSECSRSCGTGIKRRTATCVSSSTTLDPLHCSSMSPPVTSQPCNMQRCPTWVALKWTACNATCGTGWRVRPYFCQADGKVLSVTACDARTIPKIREECVAPNRLTCARWETSQWSSCDCSTSLQARHLHCISTTNFTILPHKHCQDFLRPNISRACSCTTDAPATSPPSATLNHNHIMLDNYTWRSGPWGECSRACGAGTKSRNVACVDQNGVVEVTKCQLKEKPISKVQCMGEKCGQWNTGDWGECSPDCHRYRLVICQNKGNTIPSNNCPISTRPQNKSTCTNHPHCSLNHSPVHRYKWKIGEWSPCSRSCGRGIRTRQVICLDLTLNATLVDTACLHKKPKTQRACHKSECSHMWIEGPWTPCTKSCGEGIRYRNVTCHHFLPHRRSSANPMSQTTCDQKTLPSSSEKCNLRSCENTPQYTWATGPWKTCSHSCGNKGRQIRQIHCQYLGKKIPKKFCPRNSKPQRKQKCNIKKCGPSTFHNCLDVKRGLLTTQDGDYEINVAGRIIKIYCYNMNGVIPHEYLSLPGDGRENYAETYGKQLLEPDSCPNAGQRLDNCTQCTDNDSGIAGMTIFYKIRINISSLVIIPDDFTFSHQMYGTKIPFGTAGDCYSRYECPQGRFAINLENSGFQIHPSVEWRITGVGPSMSVVKQLHSVSGKCGGYCGGCAPDARDGLLLQPDGG